VLRLFRDCLTVSEERARVIEWYFTEVPKVSKPSVSTSGRKEKPVPVAEAAPSVRFTNFVVTIEASNGIALNSSGGSFHGLVDLSLSALLRRHPLMGATTHWT